MKKFLNWKLSRSNTITSDTSLDLLIGDYVFKPAGGRSLLPTNWSKKSEYILTNSPYAVAMYSSLKDLSLNDFKVYNSNNDDDMISKTLNQSFYNGLQENILKNILVQGGIAFFCDLDNNNVFTPTVIPFDSLDRSFENGQYYYNSGLIDISEVNYQLELLGREKIKFLSELPEFKMYIYDYCFDNLPKPKLAGALPVLVNLLKLDQNVSSTLNLNVLQKVLLTQIKEDDDKKSREEVVFDPITDKKSDEEESKNKFSKIIDYFKKARALGDLNFQSFLSYWQKDVEIKYESSLEDSRVADTINNILLDRLPAITGLSRKALGIKNASGLNYSNTAYDQDSDSLAGEEIARFVGKVITDLYKYHQSLLGTILSDDFYIEVLPSTSSALLKEQQSLELKEKEIKLKMDQLLMIEKAIGLGFIPDNDTIIGIVGGNN